MPSALRKGNFININSAAYTVNQPATPSLINAYLATQVLGNLYYSKKQHSTHWDSWDRELEQFGDSDYKTFYTFLSLFSHLVRE